MFKASRGDISDDAILDPGSSILAPPGFSLHRLALLATVIARVGSSSPGLCISRTNAGGAPCSGPTRPARLASLGGAAYVGRR